jgi:hypothetical protein
MRLWRIGHTAALLLFASGCSEHAVLALGGQTSGATAGGSQTGAGGTTSGELTALRLGGATAQVQFDDAPEFDLTNHFTIEAWLWPYRNVAGDMLLCKADALRESKQIRLAGGEAVPIISLNMTSAPSPAELTSTVALSEMTWHHLAFSYGDGQLLGFVDGKRSANLVRLDPVEDGVGALYLGACPRNGDLLPGRDVAVSDFRVSRLARYADDFVPETRLAQDAQSVALFKLDEGSGQSAFDSGPHALLGNLEGDAAWVMLPTRNLP